MNLPEGNVGIVSFKKRKRKCGSPSAAPRSNFELICIGKYVVKLLTKVTVVTIGFQQLPVGLDPSIHMCCSLTHTLAPAVGLTTV